MRQGIVSAGVVLALVCGMGGAEASKTVMPYPSQPWVIDAAEYTGTIAQQIARFDARYTIRVLADAPVEVPLGIDGATITAIEIEKKTGDAHLVPQNGRYVFRASRKGVYRVRVTFAGMLAQDSQFEGLQFGIPQATFSTVEISVPRQDVELRLADQLYVERKAGGAQGGVTLIARIGASDRVDLKWRTKPADPVKVEPILYGDVQTLVTVEDQLARIVAMAGFRAAQGETRTLTVLLPAAVNVLNVRGAGIDDWKVAETADGKTVTVALNFPLKDAFYHLVIEGETPIPAEDGRYALPEIRLAGVKQERGYIAIARMGAVELSPDAAEGITRVDVKELPDGLRTAGGAPAVLAFKYHQHPYRAALSLTRHDDHPVLAAIAERGELATVVSRQGELLTRAVYLLKANKKQFLDVRLPEGATLWSCLVAGRSVKPVEGKTGGLLVPLDAAAESTASVTVELVYFERRPELVRLGRLSLEGPVLDVPTTVSNWLLYAPRDVQFLRMRGNLDRGAAAVEFIEDPMALAAAPSYPASQMVMGMVGDKEAKDEQRAEWEQDREKNKLGKVAAKAAEYARQLMDGRGNRRDSNEPLEEPPAFASTRERFEGLMAGAGGSFQEQGILPLKIQLPKAGKLYRFHRLMTSQDPLRIDTTYVHVKTPWLPFAAAGLLMMPVGGLAFRRVRRS